MAAYRRKPGKAKKMLKDAWWDKFNVGFKMEISTRAVLPIAMSAKESTYGAMVMNTQESLLTA